MTQFLAIFGTTFLAWELAKGFCAATGRKAVLSFLEAVPRSFADR